MEKNNKKYNSDLTTNNYWFTRDKKIRKKLTVWISQAAKFWACKNMSSKMANFFKKVNALRVLKKYIFGLKLKKEK